MPALSVLTTVVLSALESLVVWQLKAPTTTSLATMDGEVAHSIVTDLTVKFCSSGDPPTLSGGSDFGYWHRLEKHLCLHSSQQRAWLYMALTDEQDLSTDHLVVTDVKLCEQRPLIDSIDRWESRPGGIWLLRSNYTNSSQHAATGVDVLFGTDAIEPRPQWALLPSHLQLDTPTEVPVARLSICYGEARPKRDPEITLRVRDDGKFTVVQISDTHMVTGVGVCNDAIDAHGQPLPESVADPLTVDFMGSILDAEKPDLVILTGDQLHHDILDSQSTLFKVYAPLIERSIPYASVFGNHDSEGAHTLSRNYYLQILAAAPSQRPVSTLFFLDSHAGIPSEVQGPDYDPIKQSQIDWFISTSRALRKEREKGSESQSTHLSLVFQHIPLPECGNDSLLIRGGHRREPTEGPSFNSHFYDALVEEGIVALGCGHDHVNDFCGLLPQQGEGEKFHHGPWLCYAGGTGFGGYCSYGDKRYHRRARVWELDSTTGDLTTWKRVEYVTDRIDELVLVKDSKVAHTHHTFDGGISGSNGQAVVRPEKALRPCTVPD